MPQVTFIDDDRNSTVIHTATTQVEALQWALGWYKSNAWVGERTPRLYGHMYDHGKAVLIGAIHHAKLSTAMAPKWSNTGWWSPVAVGAPFGLLLIV
jgi:hypothetical protein